MKKTALQQLIEKLSDKKDEYEFNTDYDDGVRRGLALAMVKAKEQLETEREQIEEAYNCGNLDNDGFSPDKLGEQYYKDTYQ